MIENILFMFDSGLGIDKICIELNLSESVVTSVLINNKRIKRTYKRKE